jgi:hypothetical protein
MRDVYRIRPRRHEALGAKPPDDIDSIPPHTSISSPLKAGFLEERKNVEVSEGIDVRDEVIVKRLNPAKIASAATHEEIISVPVWILPGHSSNA